MGTIRTYIALVSFLGFYFALIVIGNLLYFTDLGPLIGQRGVAGFSIHSFAHAGSAGYWLLLFLPFILTPPIAVLVRHAASPLVKLAIAPSLPKSAYAILIAALYSYAALSLWRADAWHLLLNAQDHVSAVENRFRLFDLLGFWPLVVIKSVLFSMSVYGLLESLMQKHPFWKIATAFNLIAMPAILILLNMKWPLVLFYVAHFIAILMFAKRPFLPAILFATMTFVSYFLISLMLLRVTAGPATIAVNEISRPIATPTKQDAPKQETVNRVTVGEGLFLSANAVINRMAQPFPFYFEIFSQSPHQCGSLLGRILRRQSPCQPSNVVYAAMFSDRFAGEGTAPQPPHVTGFAIQGWSGALIEITLTSVVLGLFAAVSGGTGALQATISVMGAVTGYFYSQLPFEGPIIYDHGVLWWGVPLLLYGVYARVATK
ncbi:hypothetical protein J4G48_0031745 [Bradyrhizobium barranii subsp. apii]|uniref:hypothetical protein n=1 Tax=Bradyrhizobium barranii TaxID=2992140 RepID=UPI001AA196C7|nr:hypothetical protein [Bradyrhizobium barranii]UPT93886.1 hypothetical protein J4G48_0031745 [Bradyrhizobium barranii subsp. apii]